MNFVDLLKPMVKSSIRITYDEKFIGECPIGSSKIGGRPDLPSDFQWSSFYGKDCDYVADTRPLSFLAQINLEEINSYDKEDLLPPNGMLYFFYDLATMTWGFDPHDRGSSRVYYYTGDVSELKRTEFPSKLLEEYRLPEMPITFSTKADLPYYDEFCEWHSQCSPKEWEEYYRVVAEMGFDSEEDKISKLLGYADLVQGSMLLECELTANCTNPDMPILFSTASPQQKEHSKKWTLLFQLDSIETKDYELLWGDVGRIYYYINADDLKEQNFNNCWLILQCS